ncbi:MAG: hypothetical protein C0597_02190 [Marinilabiliales bacterium]|nr:MAG: hypothetical protein C0597_02190 [Marinilabiliales bacterium]
MKKYYVFILLSFISFNNLLVAQTNELNILSESIFIIDGHTHHGFPSLDSSEVMSEMKYLRTLGYNAIVHELPIERSETDDLYKRVSNELFRLEELSENNEFFEITKYPKSFSEVPESEKIHCMFAIEHFRGSIFNEDTSIIRKYGELGVQYITLVNTEYDRLFTTSNDISVLSKFGKEVIDKMNEIGISIDISHMSEEDMLEVITYSKSPVIASHSSGAEISLSEDNLSNKVLYQLKENRGLVLLSFRQNRLFNTDDKIEDGVEKFIDHVDYLKSIIGINKIGIGTDIQANGKYMASGLSHEQTFQNIANALSKRGYTQAEIEKIFYKNYLDFVNKN